MREFQVARRDPERKPVDSFRLRTGKMVTDPDDPDGPEIEKVHDFRLFKPADSAMLMSFNLATRLRENASDEVKQQAVAATIDFLGACMDPDEYKTLYEVLVDPAFGMDTSELVELCTWALKTVTGRPTKRSTGSQAGRPRTGKKSTGAARSRG